MSGQSGSTQPVVSGMEVGKACFCVAIFFGLLLLCNGAAMYQSAGRLEYGPIRDFWMAVLRPVERVSRVSGLNRVRGWTQSTVGEWLNRPEKE